MANPTTNYGFVLPEPTSLVTDLPADFDVALQGVDTQMLTNANAAIAKTIVDAKGDIIGATADDTVSRLAVGANDTVLTADSTAATGLKWAASSAGALTLVASTSISAATSISVNNCFTSTYANYLLLVDIPTNTGTDGYITVRLRASGTDTTTGYAVQKISAGASVSAGRDTFFNIMYSEATDPGITLKAELFRPNMAEKTRLLAQSGYGNDEEQFLFYGQQTSSTQFDGFTITGASTLTGTIRVYGYQNS